ncbi:farnesol dehydrogenase-like [Phlebotomus argentipes]|uniref:farnesol dehydrogenase-like n=1 Tax=Phlebotomus argentipes TaxID=94469 RepID=UPI0028932446|nr:farnesol dehydrogenase-like [Phlebotomus argentipes]
MEQWKNRVAVVTGASAGIGAAIVKDLVKAGMITIGLARRSERVEALKKQLPANLQGNLHAVKCDVSKEEDIVRVFDWIETKFHGIDVLINNAGIVRDTELIKEGNSVPIREIIDTNVFGVVFCTREAYKSMANHGRNSHIVHINSIAGHGFTGNLQMPSLNIYPPSKCALTAITEIHRQEFIRSKHHIKVTSVSPGAVKTEIVPDELIAKFNMQEMPILQAEDVSQSVLHVLGTPPHVQIHELTIKPFGEKY